MSIRESRFSRLASHFFRGFLENDLLMSSQASLETLLAQVIGLVVAPGLFYCLLLTLKYGPMPDGVREAMSQEDRLLFIQGAMILTGLVTIIEWDALFPDRRDYLILGPLPISTRIVFVAKACSVCSLVAILWAAQNAGAALLFPLVAMKGSASGLAVLRNVGAQLAATLAASAFVFTLFAGLQGVLLNTLSHRLYRRVSLYVQMALVLVLVAMFLAQPVVMALANRWIVQDRALLRGIPCFWFLGLYQVIIGRDGPVWQPLAGLAWKALLGAALVAALAYLGAYRRHLRGSLETADASGSWPGFAGEAFAHVVHLLVLRHPVERGYFHFICTTLLRSRIHRLLLAAWLAAGFAIALAVAAVFSGDAVRGLATAGLLSIQLVLLMTVIVGMRFVFTLPAELSANWAFQAAEPEEKSRASATAWKTMLIVGACPVLLILAPLHGFFLGWRIAAAHLLFGLLVSGLFAGAVLAGFAKIPFTCTYRPGRANIKALWPVYLVSFWACVHELARLESTLVTKPAAFGAFCAGAVCAIVALGWYHTRQFGKGFQFTFEDVPEPAVRTLDIGHGARSLASETPAPSAAGAAPRLGMQKPPLEPSVGALLIDWIPRAARELRDDLRCGLRMLVRNAGFTLAAVAMLSAAIGANTLLFTFFSALVLKPLPIRDRERHARLTAVESNMRTNEYWSYPDFRQLRRNPAFAEMYAWAAVEITVRQPLPRKVRVHLVSGNFLGLFQARMIAGRPFSAEEDEVPGRDAVIVLSRQGWGKVFGGRPGITGQTVRAGNTVLTVLGVTDGSFAGADPLTIPDLWAPIAMYDRLTSQKRLSDPRNAFLRVAGLLSPGVTPARARQAIAASLDDLNSGRQASAVIVKVSIQSQPTYIPLEGKVWLAAASLFTLFGLVLLVACANVASILAARGAARRTELAIRASLGGSRRRLIRQMLTESILLCVMAAIPALLLTLAALGPIQRYLWTLIIEEGFNVQPLSTDWRAFVFLSGLTLGAGILLGVAPALEATRTDLAGVVKQAGSGAGHPRRRRELFVLAQVAASLVLLVVAGIFTRNAYRVSNVDPGIETGRLIDVRGGGKSALAARLRREPRFDAVVETCRVPLSGAHGLVMGKANGRSWPIFYNCVESRYFEAVGLRIRRGRLFTADEARAGARVTVLSEATANRLWPGEDPLGKTLSVDPSNASERFPAGEYEVIGVVPDVVNGVLNFGQDYTFAYIPAEPGDPRNGGLIARTRDISPASMGLIRQLCADTDGSVCDPVRLHDVVRQQRFPFIASSMVACAISLIAMVMASAGLYGIVALGVVQRTHEIGLCMALGATRARVLHTVLVQSMRPVALGILIGLPVSLAFSNVAGRLFVTSGIVRLFDPGVFVAAPCLLAAISIGAAYLPARRATRIDPAAALRV